MRNFLAPKPALVSKEVEISEAITAPGRYIFEVSLCRAANSRFKGDGSLKAILPEYSDGTDELFMVLVDKTASKRMIHVTSLALDAFIKTESLSAEEKAHLTKNHDLQTDQRDGYAMIRVKKGAELTRIPAQEGDKAFEDLREILSKFTQSCGLPIGTDLRDENTPALLKGKIFKGTLEVNSGFKNGGEAVDRLKLKPNFYPLSDEEIAELEGTAAEVESFQ
jgi:hypothetical protein